MTAHENLLAFLTLLEKIEPPPLYALDQALPQFRAATAYEMAFRHGIGGTKQFSFGMDELAVVQHLRELADRIERKELLLQTCNQLTRIERDNFAMTYFELMFHEKNK
jgi:hypothetical protein